MTAVLHRSSLDAILRRSARAESAGDEPDFSMAIDGSRWFVCPTLTPLYYAPIYRDLDEDQRRRYNQLTALCFNELISFFEESFAASVLAAIAQDEGRRVDRTGTLADEPTAADDRLAACLEAFLREERKHIGWWRTLNRLTEPGWYSETDSPIIRLSACARRTLRFLTARPGRFPVVFWVMLALEERSLDISRRCLQMDPVRAEPHYRAVYRRHLKDETRHVQLDCYLIERFYADLSRRRRRLNARLLATLIGRFFLPPTRSAVRVVRRLVAERPELAPQLGPMVRQLRRVGDSPDYHEMMYSRRTTPLTFALFDRFEEMHRMRSVLRSYQPTGPARRA